MKRFLPAAGYRYDDDLGYAGSRGYYWSSSLSTDYSYLADLVDFSSDNVHSGRNDRFYGQSVRPVSE